jgi:hypothetical protein
MEPSLWNPTYLKHLHDHSWIVLLFQPVLGKRFNTIKINLKQIWDKKKPKHDKFKLKSHLKMQKKKSANVLLGARNKLNIVETI